MQRVSAFCRRFAYLLDGVTVDEKAPGSRCWVSVSDNPKRKLQHTLEVLEADGTLVAMNTMSPNKIAEAAIANAEIAPLAGYDAIRREVKYGTNSRIDLLLTSKSRPDCYVEVKNCHLMRTPGLAEFPDSVTTRGAKHLFELSERVRAGDRAVQLFIVQRGDCTRLSPADDLDAAYAKALRDAAQTGVEILAFGCAVTLEGVTLTQPMEIAL
jgi:sugar fermentation stimulation protein A